MNYPGVPFPFHMVAVEKVRVRAQLIDIFCCDKLLGFFIITDPVATVDAAKDLKIFEIVHTGSFRVL
jgi:hypothetical protein